MALLVPDRASRPISFASAQVVRAIAFQAEQPTLLYTGGQDETMQVWNAAMEVCVLACRVLPGAWPSQSQGVFCSLVP